MQRNDEGEPQSNTIQLFNLPSSAFHYINSASCFSACAEFCETGCGTNGAGFCDQCIVDYGLTDVNTCARKSVTLVGIALSISRLPTCWPSCVLWLNDERYGYGVIRIESKFASSSIPFLRRNDSQSRNSAPEGYVCGTLGFTTLSL